MNEPSQAAIAAAFDYDAERGLLIWKPRHEPDFASKNAWAVWNAKYAGQVAGWICVKGYRTIRFAGKCRKASRLIWVLMNGAEPDRVDHIDGQTSNDRIDNLRDVSQAVNSQNRARQINNTSGAGGVYQSKAGRWIAQLNVGGKRRYLGSYSDKSDAALARRLAASGAGFHPNHDRTRTGGD